ncbi:MAG: C4-dicarboxylate transporter DcuC [Acidaminococcaceae bacterium]
MMFIILGAVIVVAVIYLLLKRHESRMVLIAAGILMALLAGKPLAALDAFAKSMTNAGLITSVCSCMGFALVMKYTGCDKHLVQLIGNVLKKLGFLLIPGATIATFIVNIAIPSAAGCTAAVGVIFIPILMSAGVHPAMAAAAVKSGTFGSMLNPGLVHNGVSAKLAGVPITEVISRHMVTDVIGMLVAAASLTVLAIFLKENSGHAQAAEGKEENLKINFFYAFMPLLPVVLLLLGSTKMVPALAKVGVPHAMVIGAIVSLFVTRSNPTKLTKSFFDGMGDAYANIIGIIISVGVFVSGMQALGLVKALITAMLDSTGIVKIAATFGPFILAMISGSGDAATVAFNEAVTPHAAQFGLQAIDMGSMAALAGTLGRTMSPIAGATIIAAGIAGVDPMEVCKRNSLGIFIALLIGMYMLLG